VCIAFYSKPIAELGASPAILDHAVLLAIWHSKRAPL